MQAITQSGLQAHCHNNAISNAAFDLLDPHYIFVYIIGSHSHEDAAMLR